jgi:AraC family transcriptional regulator, arabinose operon regulatory protein
MQSKGGMLVTSFQDRRRDPRIQSAVDIISRDYRRQIRLEELARTIGLSVSHFAHLFQSEVGVSPARFLRELRFRQAEQLIRTTTLPLSEVLPLAGITERSHFMRAFKQRFGLSPSKYRAQCPSVASGMLLKYEQTG